MPIRYENCVLFNSILVADEPPVNIILFAFVVFKPLPWETLPSKETQIRYTCMKANYTSHAHMWRTASLLASIRGYRF